jgi:hypothetical protein
MLTEQRARRICLVVGVVAVLLAVPAGVGVVAVWRKWGPEIQVDPTGRRITVGYKAKIDSAIDGLILPPVQPIHDDIPLLQIAPPPAAPDKRE